MKILTVTNPERVKQIHLYASMISKDLIEEVEEAFEFLDLHVEPEDVEEIADSLEHNQNFWFKKQLCFEVVDMLEF